jgi:hypothetical protein
MTDDDHFHFLRKGDLHLAGETESRDWLKSVPKVYGLGRQIKDLQKTTTAKHNGNKPPTTPEAA